MSDTDKEQTETSRYGRRMYDMGCNIHEEQIDALQAAVNNNNGKYTSLLWFIGVIGTVIGCCLTVLLSKTTSIESLLTDNKVALAQHTEQISTLRKDIDGLKVRVDELAGQISYGGKVK